MRELDMPPAPVRFLIGCTALLIFLSNTVFWCSVLLAVRLAKALVPIPAWKRFTTKVLMGIGSIWIDINSWGLRVTQKHRWDVQGLEGLTEGGWYLVSSNHRSMVDIVVLQRVFNHRIPFLKFFLKQRLIWVPFLGQAWWALDFPFMRRYSREELEKRPELRGKDLETTRKACDKFRLAPMSIINFLEGTRFSEAKRERQKSPYRNLLLPRAGGIAFVLSALGDRLTSFVDVTIAYPDGTPGFWGVLSRRLDRIVVRVKSIPIPPELIGGDYIGDAAYRERVQAWVRELWSRKDAEIDRLLALSSECL
jgi:1-acyl-sn-glycerol-3-phosphate acyltransferase